MPYQVMDNGVVRDATPEEVAEIEARMNVDLAALREAAIAKTYLDVDKVTFDAVGNRVEEYKVAESAARAFRDVGYVGEVDISVSAYAQHNPTGEQQTNQWAADQIIERADAFRAAQDALRVQRFASQAAMRAATTAEELAAAVAAWNEFIVQIRADLGL